MSVTKKEIFNQLKAELEQSKINIPTIKFRNLKKDPLMLARSDILNGAIYFEYCEGAYRPFSCFLTSKIGEIYYSTQDDSKEEEYLFIQFGSFKSLAEMVQFLDKKLSLLQTLFG